MHQIDLKRLRGEWRDIGLASIKLMHRGLWMLGLFAVALGALLTTHPEYARSVGQWMTASYRTTAHAEPSILSGLDPSGEQTRFGSRIAMRTEEASRLLGLMNRDLSPAEDDAAVTMHKVSVDADSVLPLTREEREVTRYISHKYRVNNDAISLVVDAAYATGKDLHIDPALLLAVMAVESGFNPFAQSTAGASGLMQLMSKVHGDKLADFGGANIALNPVANVRVGAAVLKDCIRRGGSVADGLRLYVGAGNGEDNGYGARVLQERDRILQASGRVRSRVELRREPHAEPIPSTNKKLNAPAHTADQDYKPDGDKADTSADSGEARLAVL